MITKLLMILLLLNAFHKPNVFTMVDGQEPVAGEKTQALESAGGSAVIEDDEEVISVGFTEKPNSPKVKIEDGDASGNDGEGDVEEGEGDLEDEVDAGSPEQSTSGGHEKEEKHQAAEGVKKIAFDTGSVWHDLVLAGDVEAFKAHLAQHGPIRDVNATIADGATMWHCLIYAYMKRCAKKFDKYPELNPKSDRAWLRDWLTTLRTLNVDATIRNKKGLTPAEVALEKSKMFDDMKGLMTEVPDFIEVLREIPLLIQETSVTSINPTSNRSLPRVTETKKTRSWCCCCRRR